jgi:hypothetical protein
MKETPLKRCETARNQENFKYKHIAYILNEQLDTKNVLKVFNSYMKL